jgi:dUTP pyrophosphatase
VSDDGLRIAVQRIDPTLPLPAYARDGDAGLDLHAAEPVTLAPGARALVPTGIAPASCYPGRAWPCATG